MRAHEGRRDSLTSPLRETKTDTRELLEGPKKNNILPDEGQFIYPSSSMRIANQFFFTKCKQNE